LTNRRRWLVLFLGLTLVRGLIYAAVTPPWQSPDENGHLEYAWLIAHLGRLPTHEDVSPAFERELLGSLYEWRYGEFVGRPLPEQMPTRMNDLPPEVFARRSRTVLSERFSLAYLWQALFLSPFRSQDLIFQLFIARLSSVLLSLGITWLAFLTFEELELSSLVFIASMAVVIFLPQHTFINSMVGEGPLAELVACLVIYCWTRLFHREFRFWEAIGIVSGTFAGMWSKSTATFLMPVDVWLAIWFFLRRQRRVWTRRSVIYSCAGIVVLGLGLWGWSHSRLGAIATDYAQLPLSSPGLLLVDERGITIWQALGLSYDSFWANFGWMALPVSQRWYGAITLLSLMAAVGWIIGGSGREEDSWIARMMGGIGFVAWAMFISVAIAFRPGYYQYQGRYLFPVIIPYTFLLVGGLERLFSGHLRRSVVLFFLLALVCFDVWCIVGYIIPCFY